MEIIFHRYSVYFLIPLPLLLEKKKTETDTPRTASAMDGGKEKGMKQNSRPKAKQTAIKANKIHKQSLKLIQPNPFC